MTTRNEMQKMNANTITDHKNHVNMIDLSDLNKLYINTADHAVNSVKYAKRKHSNVFDTITGNSAYDIANRGISLEDMTQYACLGIAQSLKDNHNNRLIFTDYYNNIAFKQAKNAVNAKITALQREIIADSNNDSDNEHKPGELKESFRMQWKQDDSDEIVLKREKINYIFSRMTPEEVKLIRCYVHYYHSTKDNGTLVEYVSANMIRTYMHYGDLHRTNIKKRMRKAINSFKYYWKQYDIDGYNGIYSMSDYNDMIVTVENGKKVIRRKDK